MKKFNWILVIAVMCMIVAPAAANADFALLQKTILGDTSPATPSLASLNGILYIAWNGTDSAHRLNVMSSADNGRTFGNKYTSGETSPAAPALAVHNGKLYITWRGTGNQWLNVAAVNTQGNNVTGFSQKVILRDTSPSTPSLASLNGRLYLAWNGTDSAHRLNVMSSADNGRTFGNKYTSGETSPAAPALAVHNGKLYITWRGTGNQWLNVAAVNTQGNNVTGFSQKVILRDTSPSTPSLASLNGRLYLAWNGTDSAHRLNVMSSADNGLTFVKGSTHCCTQEETSPAAPALAVHNSNLYVTWRGSGNQWLNVAELNITPVTQVSLNATRHAQETGMWCWAASGQMVMDFLGNNVAQCIQANNRFGRNDCCNIQLCPNPVAKHPCVSGGWPEFNKYNFVFNVTSNKALSWDELSRQINCLKKPVAFSWGWIGGGGHMMVADGVRILPDGTQWVEKLDPWSPCNGDTTWITYANYDQQPGDHTHWNDYYNITRR